MRWAYQDASGHVHHCTRYTSSCVIPHQGRHQKDVLDLAYEAYQNALPSNYHPSELHFSGQSFGTQIAIQLTDLVMRNQSLPQPTRLSLLDPYFSPDHVESKLDNIPDSVAQYNTDKISDIECLNPKFPISVYRTSTNSFAPTGNPGLNLMDKVSYIRLYPEFLTGQKLNRQV